MCVGNTYFEHKNFHHYTRVARGQDGVEVKIMTELMLAKMDMLLFMQDVRAVRDHHAVLCNVRLVGTWIKMRVADRAKRRIC